MFCLFSHIRNIKFQEINKTASHQTYGFIYKIGGAKEDRTPDLLNAIQALSQLSYNPNVFKRDNKDFFYNVNIFIYPLIRSFLWIIF